MLCISVHATQSNMTHDHDHNSACRLCNGFQLIAIECVELGMSRAVQAAYINHRDPRPDMMQCSSSYECIRVERKPISSPVIDIQ